MKLAFAATVALGLCWIALLGSLPVRAASVGVSLSESASISERLEAAIGSIAPISQKLMVRRRIAQATFCLPQSMLGWLLYGFLQLSGNVLETAEMNEVTIVVTEARVGVALGAYIVVHKSLVRENVLRHEYGHTLQGYQHGPFYLLLEGFVSFVQASISMISPSFAADYYNRWPENEATELGAGA